MFPTRFLEEYHQRINRTVRFGNVTKTSFYLRLGVDPNWDNHGFSSRFIYTAIYNNNLSMVELLLDAGCEIDDIQTECSSGYHSNALLMAASLMHRGIDLSILHLLDRYLGHVRNRPCLDCKMTMIEMVFHHRHFKTCDHIYELIRMGAWVANEIRQDLFDTALHSHHVDLVHTFTYELSIFVFPHHVYYALHAKTQDTYVYDASLLMTWINRITQTNYTDERTGQTIFHMAVRRGDQELLSQLVSKQDAIETLGIKDDNDQTALQLAVAQQKIPMTLFLFHIIIQHQLDTIKIKQTRPNAWYGKRQEQYDMAQLQFYNYVHQQIEQFREHGNANIVTLFHLVDDFYHPSGIGYPDHDCMERQEVLGLDYDEVHHMIDTWASTNPLAAMRWQYVL